MGKLNANQAKWQAHALDVLLENAYDVHERGPWIPSRWVIEAVRGTTGCTQQAATGALRALRAAGVAEHVSTSEGGFWKATPTAERCSQLLRSLDYD